MKWMKVKMEALGVLNNDKFKVAFMLDYRSMLTVHNAKYGECSWARNYEVCDVSRQLVVPKGGNALSLIRALFFSFTWICVKG